MWQRRPSGLRSGDHVRARLERWRVAGVRRFAECEALRLHGASVSNRGADRTLLYPFDRPQRIAGSGAPKRVGRSAWLRRAVSVCREASRWDRLMTATDARIDLLPYQLEPALAMLRGDALRMLLADAVGLGKTIQAGLLLRELAARGDADRVLIVTPAGLRDQWRSELKDRFDLDTSIVDAALLRRTVVAMPRGTNPLTLAGIHILSVDFIKRPEVLQAVDETVWDVLVIDEAHGLTRGTDRGAAGRALASRARRVVLISATPHQGDDEAFRALTTIGAFDTNEPLMTFRRTRADVGVTTTRRTRLLRVRPTSAEARMHALLGRYTTKVTRHVDGGHVGRDALLAMIVLRKRSLSSARSLAASLERRLRWLDADRDRMPQLPLPLVPIDAGEGSPEDEEPDEVLAAPGLSDAAAERSWIRAVLDAARSASLRESKLAVLQRLLRRTTEPVVVFTEFRDTLAHVARTIAPAVTCEQLHGALTRPERSECVRRFTTGAARLLLATDAAAEGLNLQARCRWIINLELPWNPLRLEQRIGRVDRVGQTRRVHALHLIARGTAEEDLLDRLASRLSRVRATLGDGPQPLPALGTDDDAPRVMGPDDKWTESAPVDLREVAESEAARVEGLRRLGAARLFIAGHAAPDSRDIAPGRAWLARASRARRATLFVFAARMTDGRGALVETNIIPVLAPADCGVEALAGTAPACVAEQVRRRSASIIEARTTLLARLASRERDIACAGLLPAAGLFQPGLFDHRAERAARSRIRRAEHRKAELSRRLASLDAARVVHPPDTIELLLVRTRV